MKAECGACRFFHSECVNRDPPNVHPDLGFIYGECRHDPPKYVGYGDADGSASPGYGAWPIIQSCDWCGKFSVVEDG